MCLIEGRGPSHHLQRYSGEIILRVPWCLADLFSLVSTLCVCVCVHRWTSVLFSWRSEVYPLKWARMGLGVGQGVWEWGWEFPVAMGKEDGLSIKSVWGGSVVSFTCLCSVCRNQQGTWLLKNKIFACLRGINSFIFLEDNAVMWPVFAKFRLMHGQMTTGSGLQTPI